MDDTRVILSGLWVSLMLTYLLGDVLRVFSGDFAAGMMGGKEATQMILLAAAVLMLVPIVMVVLSLILKHPAARWLTIVAAVLLFIVNVAGLPTYPSAYDRFLIAVSLVINVATVWYAWKWV
jgi:hypothetical protein